MKRNQTWRTDLHAATHHIYSPLSFCTSKKPQDLFLKKTNLSFLYPHQIYPASLSPFFRHTFWTPPSQFLQGPAFEAFSHSRLQSPKSSRSLPAKQRKKHWGSVHIHIYLRDSFWIRLLFTVVIELKKQNYYRNATSITETPEHLWRADVIFPPLKASTAAFEMG